MSNLFKKIGFFLLIIIISAGFYWIIFIDKATKQDTLEYAMKLLGDKLMAMVPDNAEKRSMKKLYDKFLQQTKERQVSPEQLEWVAANILNLSHSHANLTPEQVQAILNLSLKSSLTNEEDVSDSIKLRLKPILPVPPPPAAEVVSPQEWEKLAERIKSLNRFDDHMQKTMKYYTDKQPELQSQIRYRVDKQLKIAIDVNIMDKVHQKEFEHLAKEIHKMEQEQILEWHENFALELKEEEELRRKQLESLKHLNKLEKIETQKGLETLKSLESLTSIEGLPYIPVVDVDSIQKIVKQSHKEAKQENQKKEY